MTHPAPVCPGVTRRSFLADTGMGFTGLALAAMLHDEATAAPAQRAARTHFPAKAKNVIWIFLCGGVSHVESFDVKPELTKYAGKSIDSTPYKDVFTDPRLMSNPLHPIFLELVEQAPAIIRPANLREEEVATAVHQVLLPIWLGERQPDDTFFVELNGAVQGVLDRPMV